MTLKKVIFKKTLLILYRGYKKLLKKILSYARFRLNNLMEPMYNYFYNEESSPQLAGY